MKICAISDVHVKIPHDEADRLLFQFFDHPLVRESDYVLFLGDIFDLMAGPHKEYIQDFHHIFAKMDELIKAGKKLYFFEGNHDVHLEKLFSMFWKNGEFRPHQEAVIEQIEGKSYYFSHGDEHEIDNIAYQRYKRFILSPPLRFVALHLMPYSILNFIGQKASKKSRKKGSKHFNEEEVKLRFRHGVEATTQGKYDFVLGGHSHVQDQHLMSNGKSVYINNGYALRTKTFISIRDHQMSFEPLS